MYGLKLAFDAEARQEAAEIEALEALGVEDVKKNEGYGSYRGEVGECSFHIWVMQDGESATAVFRTYAGPGLLGSEWSYFTSIRMDAPYTVRDSGMFYTDGCLEP